MISDILQEKASVMIVDDSPDNIALFSELLKDHYRIRIALNGEKALRLIREEKPDLILLDVMMPVMDGYETCRMLKEDQQLRDIPVIFLTARTEAADENIGLNLGAVDYITKPVNPQIFLSRIRAHLSVKQAGDLLRQRNLNLEEEIAGRMKEIMALQEVTVMAMSSLAEIRDNETGNHLQRTKLYARELCRCLSEKKKYRDILDKVTILKIVNALPLHDIGKIGIPDAILLKPGKLTAEEFEIMKTHTTLGKEAIEKAERMMECPDDFLRIPKEIVYGHHEKWNGGGYPRGLSGEDIPLAARIAALADVYDALRSRRIYKPPYSQEETCEMILQERGKHFSEDIVDAFMEIQDKFYEISARYPDENAFLPTS